MSRRCTVTISLRTLAVCPEDMAGVAREPEFFTSWPVPLELRLPEKGGNPQEISSSCNMSHRTGYLHVNSSLIEESVMDHIGWLESVRPRVRCACAGRSP